MLKMNQAVFARSLCHVAYSAVSCAAICFCSIANSQEVPAPEKPKIAAASDEGADAINGFVWPKDSLTMQLFAAEPMLANPVAIHIDPLGRVFVCETFRQEVGVEDNREHSEWLDEDLAAQTVADRIAYIKRHEPDAETSYTVRDDRIRLLQDTDGDGAADKGSVFADRFNAIEMGTGAGVLTWNDNVYYTCIPDLFLLKDKDNDGVADSRNSLHTGYGVRFAFRGHDMHGLIVGPDGRLYFSIGDRGYNVQTPTGVLKDPSSGAVFRCEMDGSNLEVIATGLRNPQELAFDDYGNLFTGDNNSDSGDRARWVYVVRGGDSGWRMYYQYLPDRGPFNQEKIWHPCHDETPAYIIPPVANITDGPSGLAFYPGTGMADFFKDRFFLCDFRGSASNSGVRTFRSKQKGAFWEVIDMDQTFWKMLATDVEFGPDGKLYIADWVFGWVGENKGRIYTLEDRSREDERTEVQALLADFPTCDAQQLVTLLSHRDRRVRYQAQFALVTIRNGEAHLLNVLTAKETLPRIHALWGLEQIHRRSGSPLAGSIMDVVRNLLNDSDPEVRAQAAALIGDTRTYVMEADVRKLLGDSSLRVQYYAAMALSKIGSAESIDAVCEMAEANDGDDPIVRHGAIMAIAGMLGQVESPELEPAVKKILNRDQLRSRLALVIAIRKLHLPLALLDRVNRQKAAEVSGRIRLDRFLGDSESAIVMESVRAIHDQLIEEQITSIAAMIDPRRGRMDLELPVARRVLNANYRAGTSYHAKNLAAFAADEENEVAMRIQALQMLAAWEKPSSRDWLLGDWRPLPERDPVRAHDALNEYFETIVATAKVEVRNAAIAAAGKLSVKAVADFLDEVAIDPNADSNARCNALKSLAEMKYEQLPEITDKLRPNMRTLDPKLAGTLVQVAASYDEAVALELIQVEMGAGVTAETRVRSQMCIATLGDMKSDSSLALLMNSLGATQEGFISPLVGLDVVNAAEKRAGQSEDIREQLNQLYASLDDVNDPTKKYRWALHGGDAIAGESIFLGKTEVSCVRCHSVDGTGGEVGPNLSAIAIKRDRQYLLEAIIVPNKEIAEGFTEQVILTDDGETLVGIVTEESDETIRLINAEGVVTMIPVDSVEGRRAGKSSMPENLVENLTQSEIRDLIEFLATRTIEESPDGAHGK